MARQVYLMVGSVLLLVLFSFKSYCQECPSRHFTMGDGLPDNVIYHVFKDSKGYLWFASPRGVARYNGVDFEKYTTGDGLSDNEVFFFHEDVAGRIWMPTYNGRPCFYYKGVFHNPDNDSLLSLGFSASFMQDLTSAADSSVAFFFADKRKFVSLHRGCKKVYDLTHIVPAPRHNDLCIVRKSDAATYELIYKSEKILLDTNNNVVGREKYPFGRYFNQYRDRIFGYMYIRDTIFSMDQVPLFTLGKNFKAFVLCIEKVGDDYLLGTDNGLYVNNTTRYLPGRTITGIVQDNEGRFWISTLKDGVYYFDKDFVNQHVCHMPQGDEVVFSSWYDTAFYFATRPNDIYRLNDKGISVVYRWRGEQPASPHGVSQMFDIDSAGCLHNVFGGDLLYINKLGDKRPKIYTWKNPWGHGVKALFAQGGLRYLLMPSIWTVGRYDTLTGRQFPEQVNVMAFSNVPFWMTRSANGDIWYSRAGAICTIGKDKHALQVRITGVTMKWFGVFGQYLVGATNDNRLLICSHPDGSADRKYIVDQHCIWEHAYQLDSSHVILSTSEKYRILTLLPSSDTPRYELSVLEAPMVPGNAESICSDGVNCSFFRQGMVTVIPVADLLRKPGVPQVVFDHLDVGGKQVLPGEGEVVLPYNDSRNVGIVFDCINFNGGEPQLEYSIS